MEETGTQDYINRKRLQRFLLINKGEAGYVSCFLLFFMPVSAVCSEMAWIKSERARDFPYNRICWSCPDQGGVLMFREYGRIQITGSNELFTVYVLPDWENGCAMIWGMYK